MPIRVGSTDYSKVYVGSTEYDTAYYGSTQVLAPAAAGEITYVGADADEDATGGDIALTLPTHATDDFGIILSGAEYGSDVQAVTVATGWTLLRSDTTTPGRDFTTNIWYKKFTSASESNPTITTSVSAETSASVAVFRGVDTTTAFDVTEVYASGQNDTKPQNSAITPVSDNSCLLLYHYVTHNEVSAIAVPGTPASLVLGPTTIRPNRNQGLAYILDIGTAATITPTQWNNTSATSAAEYHVYTLALRAAT